MPQLSKWDEIRKRSWTHLRDAWIADIPRFTAPGAPPDPGLEHLLALLGLDLPSREDPPLRLADVEGLRRNAFAEAVFLFHKCAHASLAAQRLGQLGMHSWAMFNAYHSAFLGARGIMALLGVSVPNVAGRQTIIDLFPEPAKQSKKAHNRLKLSPTFSSFLVIRIAPMDQSELWYAFQRVLRITSVNCMDPMLSKELKSIPYGSFSPQRNHFLYQAHFWPPLSDLIVDAEASKFNSLCGRELDLGDAGFLLRLCFSIYYLFCQLLTDLAGSSAVVKEQLDSSRIIANSSLPVLDSYANFIAQVSGSAGD